MVFGHFAVFAPAARVAQLFADGTLEESLAALAADGAVVATCNISSSAFFVRVFFFVWVQINRKLAKILMKYFFKK